MAIGLAVFHCYFVTFAEFAGVFGLIEIGEQEQEHRTVQSNPDHEVFWIITFAE